MPPRQGVKSEWNWGSLVSLIFFSFLSFFQTLLKSLSGSDFPVATPPTLTQAEYVAFLDSLPVHSSRLYFALKDGNVEEAKGILRNNPNLDVNWDNNHGHTALTVACWNYDSMVSILLVHPAIIINSKKNEGQTPFYGACQEGPTCVRLLLKDPRVEVNEPDQYGGTPLRAVALDGLIDIIEWWIASGREMDLGTPGDIYKTDAIGVAKREGYREVVTLLERFKENQEETRHAMRVQLGWYDEAASEIFALVVFVSDELLHVKDTIPTLAARFFNIARRLPLELQMIICHLVVRSPKEIIPGKDSEVAFKSLAESLLWSSIFTSS